MNFFNSFPLVEYRFGNETSTEIFRDLTAYVDILESTKDIITLYQDYYIQDGERPDQVSYKLYGNPTYHWTFFLINDKLKESGWPLSALNLEKLLKKEYPNTVVTTESNMTESFTKGQVIRGKSSGVTGTIIHHNINMGQIVVKGTVPFIADEILIDENQNEIQMRGAAGKEYEVAHHYVDGNNNWISLNDSDGHIVFGSDDTAVSLYDMYLEKNLEQRQIKVIRPNRISEISKVFKEAIRS